MVIELVDKNNLVRAVFKFFGQCQPSESTSYNDNSLFFDSGIFELITFSFCEEITIIIGRMIEYSLFFSL